MDTETHDTEGDGLDMPADPATEDSPTTQPAPKARGRAAAPKPTVPPKPPTIEPPKARAQRGSKKAAQTAELQAKVARSLQSFGGTLVILGTARQSPRLVFDGQVMATTADATAAALAEQAATSPWLAKALGSMFSAGSSATLAMALAGTVLPIAANHGLVPRGIGMLVCTPELAAAMPPPPEPPEPPQDDDSPEAPEPFGASYGVRLPA